MAIIEVAFIKLMEVLTPEELPMSGHRSRRRFRPDANEAKIVKCFRDNEAQVWIIDDPYDLLVAYMGQLFLVEVKAENGELSPKQIKNRERLWGVGCGVHIVTYVEEVIDLLTQARTSHDDRY